MDLLVRLPGAWWLPIVALVILRIRLEEALKHRFAFGREFDRMKIRQWRGWKCAWRHRSGSWKRWQRELGANARQYLRQLGDCPWTGSRAEWKGHHTRSCDSPNQEWHGAHASDRNPMALSPWPARASRLTSSSSIVRISRHFRGSGDLLDLARMETLHQRLGRDTAAEASDELGWLFLGDRHVAACNGRAGVALRRVQPAVLRCQPPAQRRYNQKRTSRLESY